MNIIQTIRTLQQAGEFSSAIELAQQHLKTDKSDLNLQALLGVLYCQQHDFIQGRDYLNQIRVTIDTNPSISLDAQTLTDIAAIHLLLKEPLLALYALNEALDKGANNNLAQIRRGIVLMQIGHFAQAQHNFEQSLSSSENHQLPALHINIARCALYLNEPKQALTHINQAQSLGGQQIEQWLFTAVDIYIALKDWQHAEHAIEQAITAGIDDIKCAKLLALVLAGQDKHAQAAHTLRQALKQHPDNIELLNQLVSIARIQGHYGEAVQCLKNAIKIEPTNASLWAQLAHLNGKQLHETEAHRAAEKALQLTKQETGLIRAEALTAMASVSTDEIQAEQYYQQALALVPDYVPACLGLGQLFLQWGRVEEAIHYFELTAERYPVLGYGALINARRFPDDINVLEQIEKIAYLPSLQGAVSSSLLFDLAAVYEHRKDYVKAFHFAQSANHASRQLLNYNAQHHSQHCHAIRRTFNADFFTLTSHYGNPSVLPTFILGMPRSGTTLVEQILGGHPDIFVAGEISILSHTIQKLNAWERHIGSGQTYPYCVRDLTAQQIHYFAEEIINELKTYSASAHHVVDKLPHNFEHIGLIRLLFPNAPIIQVLREPRDVAISNYFVDYQAKFGGMGFAYDLTDIGKQLKDYRQLMAHWNKVLIKPILTIRYEDVVNDVENSARQILNYLNLEWTSSVLNYQNLERAVKTASIWQVRQPIYQTSKEKWRRYSAYLEPLEAVLAESDDENIIPLIDKLPAGYFFEGMKQLQANELTLARKIFRDIVQYNPNHAAGLHMLAICCYQQSELQIALTLLQKALKIQPRHASWHANLSMIYSALDLTEKAKAAYERSEQLKQAQQTQDEFWCL